MAKILLVEDDLTFAQLLRTFLEKTWASNNTCAKCKNQFHIHHQNTYDLLLLDYRLPDGTGFDVLNKGRETGPTAPVIIMTSLTMLELP